MPCRITHTHKWHTSTDKGTITQPVQNTLRGQTHTKTHTVNTKTQNISQIPRHTYYMLRNKELFTNTHTGHRQTSTSTNNTQRPMDLQTDAERHTQLHTQIIYRSPYTKTQVKSTVQTLQAQQLLLEGHPSPPLAQRAGPGGSLFWEHLVSWGCWRKMTPG